MAHELNELAPGIHSFASARTDAWHRLGTVLDATMTAEQAMEAAHLSGWNVRKLGPLTIPEITESGVTEVVTDKYAVVYTNPVTKEVVYTGTVGGIYTPFQNEDSADLLQAVTEESGAIFETAGSLRGGKETFVTMKLPETLQVGGTDPVGLYLSALNSHDGMSGFRFIVSPVRIVCANTQAAAIAGARSSFTIRHTPGATRVIAEARDALGLTWKYLDRFQEEADRMIQQELDDRTFDRIVSGLWGVQDVVEATNRSQKTALEHVQGVKAMWTPDSDTMGAAAFGTRWGGYQAVTEYIDHFASVRGADDAAAARARRTLGDETIKRKERAFAAFAGVS